MKNTISNEIDFRDIPRTSYFCQNLFIVKFFQLLFILKKTTLVHVIIHGWVQYYFRNV